MLPEIIGRRMRANTIKKGNRRDEYLLAAIVYVARGCYNSLETTSISLEKTKN